MDRGLAIIVATRNRDRRLRRLLDSIFAMTAVERTPPEVIVADNGSTDQTARVVADAAAAHPTVRRLAVPEAGKSRALNAAIRSTAAEVLAFVDDDVELDRDWLVAATAYFARTNVAAA